MKQIGSEGAPYHPRWRSQTLSTACHRNLSKSWRVVRFRAG